jgi:hypothetical protein
MTNSMITPNIIAMAVTCRQRAAFPPFKLMNVWNEAKEQDRAKMIDPSWLIRPDPFDTTMGPELLPTIGPPIRVKHTILPIDIMLITE